jgi:hypothetical protein
VHKKFKASSKPFLLTAAQRVLKGNKTKPEVARILDELGKAVVEVYQEAPFTTVVITKRIDGTNVKAIAHAKYNPRDAELGIPFSEEIGESRAASMAARKFASQLL